VDQLVERVVVRHLSAPPAVGASFRRMPGILEPCEACGAILLI
jgi:hypothetical protein